MSPTKTKPAEAEQVNPTESDSAEVQELEAELSAAEQAAAVLREAGRSDLADKMLAEIEAQKAQVKERKARVQKEFKERFAASCQRSFEDLKPGYQVLAPLVDQINEVLSDLHGEEVDLTLSEISSIIQIYTGPEGRAYRAALPPREKAENGENGAAIVDADDDDEDQE